MIQESWGKGVYLFLFFSLEFGHLYEGVAYSLVILQVECQKYHF